MDYAMRTKLGWIYKNQIVTYHKIPYFIMVILILFYKLLLQYRSKVKA